MSPIDKPREFTREIIDFDPFDIHMLTSETAPRLKTIPWPQGLAPIPAPLPVLPDPDAPLPVCDILVVTWTVTEGRVLADVMTPGHQTDTWYQYRHNFDSQFKSRIRNGAPASKSQHLGNYFFTRIGGKKILCFKSELHMSQDGMKLPVKDLWKQLITETTPQLVITTGTAEAIGADIKLGDVVVATSAKFYCTKEFKNAAFHNQEFTENIRVPTAYFEKSIHDLLTVNASQLVPFSTEAKIYYENIRLAEKPVVVTTDFFAFDDSSNYYKLQGLGMIVEMGDAVLGLACAELCNTAPAWLVVRNVSNPQIGGEQSIREKKAQARETYQKYGYWTTINSAIVIWASIAGTLPV